MIPKAFQGQFPSRNLEAAKVGLVRKSIYALKVKRSLSHYTG